MLQQRIQEWNGLNIRFILESVVVLEHVSNLFKGAAGNKYLLSVFGI